MQAFTHTRRPGGSARPRKRRHGPHHPKQFLKSIKRTGFGPNLFDELRYLDHGEPGMDNSKRPLNPDFVLNQPRYQGASVLLARRTSVAARAASTRPGR